MNRSLRSREAPRHRTSRSNYSATTIVARRSITALVYRVLSLALGVATNVVVVRSLDVDNFGLISLGIAISAVVTQLADSGITQSVAKLAAATPADAHRITAVAATVRLATTCVLGLAGLGVGTALTDTPREAIVIAIILIPLPFSAAGVFVGLANAELRPAFGPALVLGQSAIWCLTAVSLSIAHPTVIAFSIGLSATTVTQMIVTVAAATRFRMYFAYDYGTARLILATSWAPGVLGLLVTAYYRLDSILVYKFASPASLGLYSASYRMLDAAQILPAVLVAPLVPLLTRSALSPDRVSRLLRETIRVALIAGFSTAALIVGSGQWLLTTLFGKSYSLASDSFAWLGVAFIGVCLGYVGTSACMALGVVKQQLTPVFLLTLASTTLQIWLIPAYGIVSAAITTAATELAMSAIGIFLAKRALKTSLGVPRLGSLVLSAVTAACTGRLFAGSYLSFLGTLITLLLLFAMLRVVSRRDLIPFGNRSS